VTPASCQLAMTCQTHRLADSKSADFAFPHASGSVPVSCNSDSPCVAPLGKATWGELFSSGQAHQAGVCVACDICTAAIISPLPHHHCHRMPTATTLSLLSLFTKLLPTGIVYTYCRLRKVSLCNSISQGRRRCAVLLL